MSYLCASRYASYQAFSGTPTSSRTSGTGPLAVSFDATGVISSLVTYPFHDLLYIWSFGDSGAGTWDNGAITNASKNAAYGAVVSHVYETPGTFTPTLTVFDGFAEKTYTLADIVVANPNTTFSGTNTIAIAANSLPVAGSGGVPAGATCINATATYGGADFDQAIAANVAQGKRVLFKGGDTFVTSTTNSISAAGPVTISSYGTGSAIVTSSSVVGNLVISNDAVNDLRVMDLTFTGAGGADTGIAVSIQAQASNCLFLRVDVNDMRGGLIVANGNSMTNCVVQDCHIYDLAGTGGVGIYGQWESSAFLGNLVGPFSTAEHCVRLQPGYKVAISYNTLTTPGEDGYHGKQVLTIRAIEHLTDPDPDTQYVIASFNKLIAGTTSAQMFQVAPASNSQNNWIYDVISEGNWIIFGANTQNGYYSEGVRLTVRNNICDATEGTFRTCYATSPADQTGGVPPPSDNWYYNNTAYAASGSTQFNCVSIDGSVKPVTNTAVINNVGYAPAATAPKMLVSTGDVTGTVANNNSTDSGGNQVKNTLPFTDATPSDPNNGDFDPANYAVGGGDSTIAVYDDFFAIRRGYGNQAPIMDMGAVKS